MFEAEGTGRPEKRKSRTGEAHTGADGSITVFFALVTVMVFALLLAVLESARTGAARLEYTIAVNSSIDSLFSQYHRKLWEDYRILGLEHYSETQLKDEMYAFIEPYLEADNWFPAETGADDIDISSLTCITGENGGIFETEVLDYMKYGIAVSIWDLADIELYEGGSTEGAAVSSVQDLYDGHAEEAADLEEALTAIASCVTASEEAVSSASSAASDCDGSSFINSAEEAITELKKLPSLADDYEKKAEALSQALEGSRSALEEKKASGEISGSVYESLNADISEYESYVDEDGERRKEIAGYEARSETNISFLEDLISQAEDIIEYIEDWEPDDEDDELDEEGLWEPVVTAMKNYDHLSVDVKYGMADTETEEKLENIAAMLKGEVLKLVLPSGAEVSTDELSLSEAPSGTLMEDASESRLELLERVYVAEYISSHMNYFGRGVYDDENAVGTGGCEQEYIIYGNSTDTDNLGAAVATITGIRTGLNLAFLYTNSQRKLEAKKLALAITGAFGLTPMAVVMEFFILSLWALAQAVMDVKNLLAGGKVPFMHDNDSFELSLSNLTSLLDIGLPDEDGSSGNGLTYADYLKILLFMGQDAAMDYRCMDIMQLSISNSQSDFLMERLAYSVEAEVHIYAAHLFSEVPLVQSLGKDVPGRYYNIDISTAYSY